MYRSTFKISMLLSVLLCSGNGFAHDPSQHKSSGEKPNCDAMHQMHHDATEQPSAVMLAMMKKCAHQAEETQHPSAEKAPKVVDEEASEHDHKGH